MPFCHCPLASHETHGCKGSKQHGSEGRNGPPGNGLYRQETSCFFSLLPAGKLRNPRAPRLEKSAFATFKQHGSEGRNRPPGDGLYCPMSLYKKLAIFLLLPLLSPAFLLLLLALLALPSCSCCLTATPRNVQLPRFEKSSFATLKQHGSEGQDGPPGDGLYCRFLKLQETSYLFAFAAAFFLLPSCSCSWPFLLSLLALAA